MSFIDPSRILTSIHFKQALQPNDLGSAWLSTSFSFCGSSRTLDNSAACCWSRNISQGLLLAICVTGISASLMSRCSRQSFITYTFRTLCTPCTPRRRDSGTKLHSNAPPHLVVIEIIISRLNLSKCALYTSWTMTIRSTNPTWRAQN